MEVVTVRNPVPAQNVGVISVILSAWSALAVFPEFLRIPALMPLSTLQILSVPAAYEAAGGVRAGVASRGNTSPGFPGMHILVLHPDALGILNCCSNVERLSTKSTACRLKNVSYGPLMLLLRFANTFIPKLRSELLRFNTPHEFMVSILFPDLSKVPRLTQIPPLFTHKLTPGNVRLLAPFTRLANIELVAGSDDAAAVSQRTEELVIAARGLSNVNLLGRNLKY
ncbi:hypothetical protein DFH09DRAFT_1317739 [Mycena vulgaris]|nr:hypothetical protein DFH09DRAFT_1317739 [Mycena vulgaris]